MNDQTAKLKCWSCERIFHIRIKSGEGRLMSRVAVIKPCPYCKTQCKVALREAQTPSGVIMKDGAEGNKDDSWFENLPPGALVEHVFESESC